MYTRRPMSLQHPKSTYTYRYSSYLQEYRLQQDIKLDITSTKVKMQAIMQAIRIHLQCHYHIPRTPPHPNWTTHPQKLVFLRVDVRKPFVFHHFKLDVHPL